MDPPIGKPDGFFQLFFLPSRLQLALLITFWLEAGKEKYVEYQNG
jgi:hypothetical protein